MERIVITLKNVYDVYRDELRAVTSSESEPVKAQTFCAFSPSSSFEPRSPMKTLKQPTPGLIEFANGQLGDFLATLSGKRPSRVL